MPLTPRMYNEAADKQHSPYHDTRHRCEQHVQQFNPLTGSKRSHRGHCVSTRAAERDSSRGGQFHLMPRRSPVGRAQSLHSPHEASIPRGRYFAGQRAYK